MTEATFEWDEKKNRINCRQHGLSFEEAKTVFYDNNAIVFDDPSARSPQASSPWSSVCG